MTEAVLTTSWRPRCLAERCFICDAIAQATQGMNFDELVVYENHHILPRYLVVYSTSQMVPAVPVAVLGGGAKGGGGRPGPQKCARASCPCTQVFMNKPGWCEQPGLRNSSSLP